VARTAKVIAGDIDFAVEASGRYEALGVALRSVRPGGRVVVVSSYGNQDSGLLLGHEFHRNRVTLLSSMTVNGCAHRAAPLWDFDRLNFEAARLLSTGALDVECLISDEIPFTSAQSAYRRLAGDRPPLKILLNYQDEEGGLVL
jgi:threonine dehydrogenase-like Zn-dependent dehydrogenase